LVYLLQHPNRSKGEDIEGKNGLTFKRVCLDVLLSEVPEPERGNLLDGRSIPFQMEKQTSYKPTKSPISYHFVT